MDVSIITIGKVVVNAIFPFFKKSKALELIKNDMLEVGDDLFAGFYDLVKPVFITDNRKSILEQLHSKPDDKIWQGAAEGAIKEEIEKEDKEFYSKIESFVEDIDKKYAIKTTKIVNELKLKGKDNIVEQGTDNELENGAELTNKADIAGEQNYVIQGKGNKFK